VDGLVACYGCSAKNKFLRYVFRKFVYLAFSTMRANKLNSHDLKTVVLSSSSRIQAD